MPIEIVREQPDSPDAVELITELDALQFGDYHDVPFSVFFEMQL